MNLLESFNIPLCQKQRIPIKTLIEQLNPNNDNKKMIESHIASISLVSILNDQTIRIRAYKDNEYSYQAIYVIDINLKKDDSIISLSEIIHSAFPGPTLLLITKKSKEYLSTATKRINKIDKSKTLIEDVLVTEINQNDENLDLSKLSFSNLKLYYEEIVQIVYKNKVFNLTKVYPHTNLNFKPLLKQYELINAKINKLKEDYKQAVMLSEKMHIDDNLYDEEVKINQIIKILKDGEQDGTIR